MSITDELREYANIETDRDIYAGARLYKIADRIDAEHEADVSTACRLAAGLDNDALAKRGYIALPVDANGVPIHVGDVMEGEKVGGGFGESFEVVGYIMSNGELEPMDEHKCPRKRKYLRHHHTPTVEDVLQEFALACEDAGNSGPEVERIAAEFAKRLRLAEEVDE